VFYLCLNPSIPLQFFKDNYDKINWYNLCQNPSIPLQFFKDNYYNIVWDSLTLNPNIDEEFIINNHSRLETYNPGGIIKKEQLKILYGIF